MASRPASTSPGATLAVGPNVLVQIAFDQTLTDNGTLSFATGDTFTFQNTESQIAVGGTLSATNTTFNGSGNSNISAISGGSITPTNCTFNLPISVQYTNVPLLAGNVSFELVNIDSATLPGGATLNLNSLGTSTANFSYGFPTGFNIALGATVAIGPNVSVQIAYDQVLEDNGTLSFASGDTLTFPNTASQIAVGGLLSATATTFNGSGNSNITVNSGGNLTPTNCTFNLPIFVQSNNVPNLAANVSFEAVNIESAILPGGTTLNLDLIGTNTTDLSYISRPASTWRQAPPSPWPNVSVTIGNQQTITDNGTLSFALGDKLSS